MLSASPTGHAKPAVTPPSPLGQINHIVVIYQENWSFDALYGNFPGANGIANAPPASTTQVDRTTGQPVAGQPTYNPAFKYANGASATLQNPPPPLINTSTGAVDTRFLTDPTNPASPSAVNTLKPYDFSPLVPASGNDRRHRPPLLAGTVADRRRQAGQVRHLERQPRPGDEPHRRHQPARGVARPAVHDGRQLLPRRLRRVVPQPPVRWLPPQAPSTPTPPLRLQPTLDATGQLALDSNGKIVHDGNITPVGGPTAADPAQTFDKNYAVNTIYSKNLAPDFVGNNTAASLLPSQNDSNPNDTDPPVHPHHRRPPR